MNDNLDSYERTERLDVSLSQIKHLSSSHLRGFLRSQSRYGVCRTERSLIIKGTERLDVSLSQNDSQVKHLPSSHHPREYLWSQSRTERSLIIHGTERLTSKLKPMETMRLVRSLS